MTQLFAGLGFWGCGLAAWSINYPALTPQLIALYKNGSLNFMGDQIALNKLSF